MKLRPTDPGYPTRLAEHPDPPTLTVSGPLDAAGPAVAIIGSRSAVPGLLAFARALAGDLARAGAVVVSGGAAGVDRAAHEGALDAGGATWVVACTGRAHVFPPDNDELFRRVEQDRASRMIWPFPDAQPKDEVTPRARNRVLVLVAHCVVVVQAAIKSGSRNAIRWAKEYRRPLFAVPGAPWDADFRGSNHELAAGGARPLWAAGPLFDFLELPRPQSSTVRPAPRPQRPRSPAQRGLFHVDDEGWSAEEKLVFSRLSTSPTQRDAIIAVLPLPTSATVTALLTLSMRDVVVEGPDGFFRRRYAS